MAQITRRASVEALKKQAYEANRWSSFDPERAGEVLLNCCEQELSEFLSKIPEEFHEEYEKRFLELFRHWLAAQSRCASPAVTGPAKFPTAKNRKYLEWERSAREKLNSWVERVVKRLNRQHRLTGWEEIERLQEKIDRLTELQELMKKANAVIRKKSIADVEKVEELENLGLTEKQALELMDGTGCWWGKGFAPFQLTNNNAKIKSTQERLDRLTKMVNTEDRTEDYEWGSLEYCYSEERLRIHFKEIPDEKLRSELKGSAFKWSRFNQAWQRQLTSNAIYAAKRILNIEG